MKTLVIVMVLANGTTVRHPERAYLCREIQAYHAYAQSQPGGYMDTAEGVVVDEVRCEKPTSFVETITVSDGECELSW